MKKVKDEGKFNKVKFHPGEIRTSAGIAKLHSKKYFFYFSAVSFRRYVSGDWGNLSEEEKKQNDKALCWL